MTLQLPRGYSLEGFDLGYANPAPRVADFYFIEGFASPLRVDPTVVTGNRRDSGPGFATGKPVQILPRATTQLKSHLLGDSLVGGRGGI